MSQCTPGSWVSLGIWVLPEDKPSKCSSYPNSLNLSSIHSESDISQLLRIKMTAASEPDWNDILSGKANPPESKPTPTSKSVEPAPAPSENGPASVPTVPEQAAGGVTRFPEHLKGMLHKPTLYETAMGFGKDNHLRIKCEKNIRDCLKKNPSVMLVSSALKSAGCELDLSRHFLCEHCEGYTAGGFDPDNRVLVVCQNNSTTEEKVTAVLTHELIHAFDYCRSKFDPNNIDHIACSEVRASAITHCSFLSAWLQGSASPRNFKNQHQECVKIRATESVMSCKGVSLQTALESVERVFPKCYADLEPFGRIPRRNSRDFDKMYYERFYYGYGD